MFINFGIRHRRQPIAIGARHHPPNGTVTPTESACQPVVVVASYSDKNNMCCVRSATLSVETNNIKILFSKDGDWGAKASKFPSK